MAYVGFDDGSKSVIYYQAKTKKLLTSRNFQMLNATPKESTPDVMTVTPRDHNMSPISFPSTMFHLVLYMGRGFYKLPLSSIQFHLMSLPSTVDLNILVASIDSVYIVLVTIEISPKLDLL